MRCGGGAAGARRRGLGGEGTLLGSAGFGHGDVAGFEFVEDLVSRGCAPGGPVGEAAKDGGVEGGEVGSDWVVHVNILHFAHIRVYHRILFIRALTIGSIVSEGDYAGD